MMATMLTKLSALADHWAVPKDPISLTIFFVTLILSWVALYTYYGGNKKRPPGPWGFPFVGYLPFLGKASHITFSKLVPKYGPVMSVKLGSMNCVVLGSYEAIKESFVKQNENFSGRPDYISFKVYEDEGEAGIIQETLFYAQTDTIVIWNIDKQAFIYHHGENWKDLRTFSVLALRELGFGRQNLEPVVQSEIQFFIKALEEESIKQSKGFPVGAMLEKSIGNAVCSLLIGHRCEYSDPWLNRLIEVVDSLQDLYVTDFTFFFPWMSKVPFLSTFLNARKRALKEELWALWKVKIDECRKAGTMIGQNFLSSWLEELQNRIDKNDPTVERFEERSLLSNIDLLCQASFETTSTALQWAFLFMLENPELQTKIQHEIDEVIGQERLPEYSDAKNMHFTRAFISETHRRGSIVPLGVFHINLEATYVMDHWIPKRTIIIPNQYGVHHDAKVFPDPERFDVSRFLDENGKFSKHESLIPFSTGKRFCPGEFVAEMEIFLYLTCLLQKYTVTAPSGLSFDTEPKDTLINHPNPYNMCIKRR